MECDKRFRELIDRSFVEEVSEGERRLMHDHIRDCDGCKRYVELTARTIRGLREFTFTRGPDSSAQVREILARGAARNRVRFVGAISHDEMPDYYRLADVTVSIPSSDGTPMSVLESMACGTPVLVSRIPNYDAHYIEDQRTVMMVDQRYSGPVGAGLIKLLQDRSLATRIANEAKRRVVASASYEAQMAKMGKLYERISHG